MSSKQPAYFSTGKKFLACVAHQLCILMKRRITSTRFSRYSSTMLNSLTVRLLELIFQIRETYQSKAVREDENFNGIPQLCRNSSYRLMPQLKNPRSQDSTRRSSRLSSTTHSSRASVCISVHRNTPFYREKCRRSSFAVSWVFLEFYSGSELSTNTFSKRSYAALSFSKFITKHLLTFNMTSYVALARFSPEQSLGRLIIL